MLIADQTIETKASKEAIWSLWSDVKNWPTWDDGIEYTTIDGPFETGTKGTLKPKAGPLVHTTLTDVRPMQSFTDEAKLPLAKIVMSHAILEKEGKRYINHRIEMRGPLAFFFAFVIGRDMKKGLLKEIQQFSRKAEKLPL